MFVKINTRARANGDTLTTCSLVESAREPGGLPYHKPVVYLGSYREPGGDAATFWAGVIAALEQHTIDDARRRIMRTIAARVVPRPRK